MSFRQAAAAIAEHRKVIRADLAWRRRRPGEPLTVSPRSRPGVCINKGLPVPRRERAAVEKRDVGDPGPRPEHPSEEFVPVVSGEARLDLAVAVSISPRPCLVPEAFLRRDGLWSIEFAFLFVRELGEPLGR